MPTRLPPLCALPLPSRVLLLSALLSLGNSLYGVDGAYADGAARQPPAGWRSWNFYACEISAAVFERQISALTDRSRTVGGKPTSLADLGYITVGVSSASAPQIKISAHAPSASRLVC